MKEYDPYHASCFVQVRVGTLMQVDGGIFNTNLRMKSKLYLKGVHLLTEDNPSTLSTVHMQLQLDTKC